MRKSVRIGLEAATVIGLWFLSNFFYSLLWRFIETRYGVGESSLTDFLLQHGPPIIPPLILLSALWYIHYGRPMVSRTPNDDGKFVPMPKAAAMAYGELRAIGSTWAAAADDLSAQTGVSEKIYFAGALSGEVPIYGKHPPSDIYEVINSNAFPRGGFEDDGAIFRYYGEKNPLYVEIAVEASDLRKAIDLMKNPKYAEG